MNISEEKTESGLLVLKLDGVLAQESANSFEQTVLAHIEGGQLDILLDCAALERVSSAGLRALFIIAKALRSKRKQLCFCSMSPLVRGTFQIAGMSAGFKFFTNLADAEAYLVD